MMEMFENRLLRMHRHIAKWARRQKISCYRVYDRDIPQFPFAIDLYEDCMYFSEFVKDSSRTVDEQAAFIKMSVETAGRCLKISPEKIFLKQRERQKGSSQYGRFDERGAGRVVTENNLKFFVNLSDYLDTGLFLDHRTTRSMIQSEAVGRHFLNLFAYTGSFSVYAAAGGAASTLTVDMSSAYLDWARKNMSLNGFTGAQHEYLETDVLQFIKLKPDRFFDLAVVDPPTFSNSKKMSRSFDVQRDHEELLRDVLLWMSPGGVVYFSTNFSKFKIAGEEITGASIKDISKQTIPKDFRNQKIHRCFRIVKT